LRHVGVDSKSAGDVDLFWACRGGGGGNFGIVTEMTIRVRKPNSEKMLVGQMRYPLEAAEEVLGYYNEWVEKIPNTMAAYGYMGNQPDLNRLLVNGSVKLTPDLDAGNYFLQIVIFERDEKKKVSQVVQWVDFEIEN